MESSKRIRWLRITYRVFLVVLGLFFLVIFSTIYVRIVGLSMNAPLHSEPLYIEVGLLAVIGAAVLIASAASGRIWARFAKSFLGVTAEEMRAVFASETLRSGHVNPKTEKAIDNLYRR